MRPSPNYFGHFLSLLAATTDNSGQEKGKLNNFTTQYTFPQQIYLLHLLGYSQKSACFIVQVFPRVPMYCKQASPTDLSKK